MFVALLVIALSLLLIKNGDNTGQDPLNKPKIWEAWYILAMTCVFDNAYAWSWGPLGTVPRCHAASAPRPLTAVECMCCHCCCCARAACAWNRAPNVASMPWLHPCMALVHCALVPGLLWGHLECRLAGLLSEAFVVHAGWLYPTEVSKLVRCGVLDHAWADHGMLFFTPSLCKLATLAPCTWATMLPAPGARRGVA